ncbi:MAG: TRAP transporter substrate-binding protein [Burkholderiales bacterium]|nr:TRAP transporter substrate-binding protein [Burkholderiales bacterium]
MKFEAHTRAMGIALAVALAGTAPVAHAQAAKYTAKIAHLEAPTQPRHKGLEKVAELVKQRTNGEVEFKLYPLSQLGNARQMVEGVQFGSIESTVEPTAFLGGFNPAVSILDVPYIFPTDRAKSQKLREGPFGKAILDSFTNKGFVALTIWPNGRKSLTSNKSLASIDDLKGQKFRVMDSKILVEQFAAVGASAIPIQFGELYTALQTGVVDGEENALDTITTMKFHEVQKNLVVTEHGSQEDIVLFNPKWWNSLPAGHRAVIAKAFDEVRPEVEKMKEQAQLDSLAIVKASPTTARIADEAERARLRELMYPRARAAYLERAGAEGKKIIETYEAELKKL